MEDNNASTVKLNQMKSILRVCLDDIDEGLKNLKTALSDEFDDINIVNTTYYSLRAEAIFEIEQILQNFPIKNKNYAPSSGIQNLKLGSAPPQILAIKYSIDQHLWTITSKLQVIREYVELSTSVPKCYVLAKSVRNIGAIFTDLEAEMEETPNKTESYFAFSKYVSFSSSNILEPACVRSFLEARKQQEKTLEEQFESNQQNLEKSKEELENSNKRIEIMKHECIKLQTQLNELTLAVETAQMRLSQKVDMVSLQRDQSQDQPVGLIPSYSAESDMTFYGEKLRLSSLQKNSSTASASSNDTLIESELQGLLDDLGSTSPKQQKHAATNNNNNETKPNQQTTQPAMNTQQQPQQAPSTTNNAQNESSQPPGRISFRRKARESEEAAFDVWLSSQAEDPTKSPSVPPSQSQSRAVSAQGPNPNPTIRLKVAYNGTKEVMTFPTNILVEDAIAQITKSHPGLKQKSAFDLQYGLFIPYPLGIWLGQKSKLEKYSFKDGTELELKLKGPVGFKQQNDKGEQLQYLNISIPASNVSRTLSFNKETTTVKDVIAKITAKYIVQDLYEWVLYFPDKQLFLNPDASLVSLDLKHMQQLVFEKIPENKQILGMDPAKLPMAQDVNSLKVPLVLIELKKWLYQTSALSQPRIFLKEGDPARMRQLFNKLTFNHKIKVTEEDSYSVASMVLNFYLSLPRPVMYGVNCDLFITDLVNKNILTSLHEPQSSLFSWLLDLLIELLRLQVKELRLESFKLVQLFGRALIGKDSKQLRQISIILTFLVGRMTNGQVVLDPVSM